MLFDRVSAGICTAGEAARAAAGVGMRGVFGVGGAGAPAVPLGARQRHAHGGARRPPRGQFLPHTGARRVHCIPHAEAIRGQPVPHAAPRGRFSPHTGALRGQSLPHTEAVRGHSLPYAGALRGHSLPLTEAHGSARYTTPHMERPCRSRCRRQRPVLGTDVLPATGNAAMSRVAAVIESGTARKQRGGRGGTMHVSLGGLYPGIHRV